MTIETTTRMGAGRPTRAEQDAASERIIAEAMRLFSTRGFAGASMEQVATVCGIGKDTLYRRYPSKVALFEAVVSRTHARVVQKVAALPDGAGDSLQRLKSLMRELLHINMDQDLIALKRIAFSEAVVFERQSDMPPRPDPIMAKLVAAVIEAQGENRLRTGDPLDIASHLIHCLVALPTSTAMLGGDRFDNSAAVDAHFDKTWAWLLEGMAKT